MDERIVSLEGQRVHDFGGIVLCGGKSSRMGNPKAWLPFGPQTMLQRVVESLRVTVAPICVVAAPGQTLPVLPADVLVAWDEAEGLGPLAGLFAGLKALQGVCSAAYATSCDVPFLRPEWVREICSRLGKHEVVVPVDEGFFHPLAAAYRTQCADVIASLLQAGMRRPADLFSKVSTAQIPVGDLRAVDPQLESLRNLNDPQAYLAALQDAGYETPTANGKGSPGA